MSVLDFLVTVGLILLAIYFFTACMSCGDRARHWPIQLAWALTGVVVGGVILLGAVTR